MDVVLYLRYSSDKQNEQSIEGQMRVCKAFCERNNYRIIESYIDRALTASKNTEKRENFLRMIKDSERKGFQAVVVYKLDRFARNRYDSAIYKNKLKKNGVRVLSATENISENPEGVILESVLEGMAEFYSLELAQKVTRGMRETALKCNSCGGVIPLGYKIENKKYVIDPATAPLVKEAFDRYADGENIVDICYSFNQRGARTTKGAKFNKNSFRSMFRNKRYIGIYQYADVEIEDGIPAIIEKEVFESVQRRLKINAHAPSRNKAVNDYLLSQKLFCGHCGAPMTGDCGTSKTGEKHFYYACPNHKRTHTCDKKNVRKELIERWVVEDALKLLTPETIEELADIAVRESEKELEENAVIPAIVAEIKDIEKRTANLFKLAEKVGESDSLAARLKELDNERKDAERRLSEEQTSVVVLEKEHVLWWFSKFATGNIENEHFRRQVIDMLINSVTVWDEPDGWYKITIVYNTTEHLSKTIRCSDLGGNGSPIEYNPNTLYFFGMVFACTTRHRAEI